jgi:hypothetical protein
VIGKTKTGKRNLYIKWLRHRGEEKEHIGLKTNQKTCFYSLKKIIRNYLGGDNTYSIVGREPFARVDVKYFYKNNGLRKILEVK